MKRMLALLVALAAAPAHGGEVEASVFSGYTTRGHIDAGAAGITELGLKDSVTWGASVLYALSPRVGIEGSWSWQPSAVQVGTQAGRVTMFDVDEHRLQCSVVYRFASEEARLRPFLSAGLGATLLGATDLDTEAKLLLGFGAGLSWRPAGRIGGRLQVRYAPTRLGDSGSDYCDPFGFCQDWLHQVEMTAGVVVRF